MIVAETVGVGGHTSMVFGMPVLSIVAVVAISVWATGVSWFDVRFRRIPWYAVRSGALCTMLVMAAKLVSSSAGGIDEVTLNGARVWFFGSAAALFVFYAVLRTFAPDHLGGGDLRLAPLLGAIGGLGGAPGIMFVTACPFAVTALIGVTIGARRGWKHVPHGPGMAACAAVEALIVLLP